ncbi:NYN domain-containing protein [Nocardioides sp. HDW12B]|uniref:NYN domain-containing protein n=1 Tax=Nocardioides sp. HDW12B TaxID=2714939 RepID=UPI00140AE24D|nr:NYN domain-containing protein [Nocardioides sp. HDW12B]QIK67531.1 NYN domain-containing protein [Nocardioides sp. HDW12B]
MATPDSTRLAVLIDGDNTTPTIIEALLAEIAKYGSATVKRAYGDWTTPNLRGWKEAINAHAIQPMQQFAYTTGKNATDSALIIDAMDLLYTGNLDGFCLVSSDSDFTKLASRLRESGKTVYGFGEPKTPKSLVAACDKFVYLDVLRRAEKSEQSGEETGGAEEARAPRAPSRRTTAQLRSDATLVRLLREGIDASSDDEGWAHLGGVGTYVAKQASDFDPRNWGYAKLVDLVAAIELFDVKRASGQGVQVRERPKGQTKGAAKAAAASSAEKPATKTAAPEGASTRSSKKATEKPTQEGTEKSTETAAEKPAKRASKRATRGSGPA